MSAKTSCSRIRSTTIKRARGRAPGLTIALGTTRRERFEALYRSMAGIPFKFHLAVADASAEGYAGPMIRGRRLRTIDKLILLREDPPRGNIRGYNELFRHTMTGWVAGLTDDCVLLPGWGEAVAGFIAGPGNRFRIGAILHAPSRDGQFRVRSYRGVPYANFFVIRRAVGDRLGWFDEGFKRFGADVALGVSALARLGVPTVPIDGCRMVHDFAPSREGREADARAMAEDNERLDRLYGGMADAVGGDGA